MRNNVFLVVAQVIGVLSLPVSFIELPNPYVVIVDLYKDISNRDLEHLPEELKAHITPVYFTYDKQNKRFVFWTK